MNSRKNLKIQIGTQEHVIAVYSPGLSRWVPQSDVGQAYITLAALLGYTDLDEAGPSIIRVEDA